MKHFGMIILLAALAMATESQDQLTLLIQIGLENNPYINAREAELEGMYASADASGFYPDPNITAGYFFTPVETKTGPQEWKLGLRQMIPGFGKLSAKKQVQILKADIAELKLLKAKLRLQSDITRSFEKLRLLRIDETVTHENLRNLQQLEAVVRSKYKTSFASQSQLIQIQLEILKYEDNLASIQSNQDITEKQMLDLIGSNTLPTLVFPEFSDEAILLEIIPSVDYQASPDYQIATAEIAIREKQISLSKLAYVPDFSLGVDYISLGDNAEKNPLMGSLGISLPIWPGKYSKLRKAANAGHRSAEYRLTDVISTLNTNLETSQLQLENLSRKFILLTQEMIPLAKQSYQVSETAYLAEKLDFAIFLEAERNLLKLKLSAASVQHDYAISLAEYKSIFGINF